MAPSSSSNSHSLWSPAASDQSQAATSTQKRSRRNRESTTQRISVKISISLHLLNHSDVCGTCATPARRTTPPWMRYCRQCWSSAHPRPSMASWMKSNLFLKAFWIMKDAQSLAHRTVSLADLIPERSKFLGNSGTGTRILSVLCNLITSEKTKLWVSCPGNVATFLADVAHPLFYLT